MPVVTIQLCKGRTLRQKRDIVRAVTDALAKTADVKPEWVTVLIDEYDRENWSSAGKLHYDTLGPRWKKPGRK